MPDSVFLSLLQLITFNLTDVSDSPDLLISLSESLFCDLAVNQLTLGICIGDSSSLLCFPGLSHAQICTVQLVLADLVVVVDLRVLVVLSRLK